MPSISRATRACRATVPAVATAATVAALSVVAGAAPLGAQDGARGGGVRDTTRSRALDTVVVSGRPDDLVGIAGSASEGRVGAAELRTRPITREGELLEAVPGLIVTQHSGEGKANQYFVRGFNLDHGTDFQTRIEGMPVNLPTHAHGQGWTDLNFLIPELVDHLDYRLGVHHARVGDFGSAGSAELHLLRRLDRPFVVLGAGDNGLARVAAGGSIPLGAGHLLAAGEARSYDGPWDVAERIRKLSGVVHYSWAGRASRVSLLGMAYRNQWNANDQVPLRAVTSGLIGRFGQIDSTDGGRAQRYSLSGTWRRAGARSVQSADIFGIYSDLVLASDFTYFLARPDAGDQFSQRDRRVVLGGSATHTQTVAALGTAHVVAVGLQTRADLITGNGLFSARRGVPTAAIRQDDVRETGTGVFVEVQSRWRSRVRSVVGLRADGYTFDVTSDRPDNSGRRAAGIVSPKASLVLAPTATSELYLSGGFGFHSNDARGVTITVDPGTGEPVRRVDPLVRSRGAELGVRATPLAGWRSTVSLWALDLDSELLFTGDGGTTEPSAASARRGATWANYYQPIPRLSVDVDLSIARARFVGVPAGETYVPGALERVVAGGATWSAPAGVFGALRVRHFGSYPLVEDNRVRAEATTLLSADVGYRSRSRLRLQATVLNLLNARAADIQYYYTSRLRGEPESGVADIHFHPVEPRQLRLSLGWGL